jgi:hypothetical protein
MPVRVRPLSFAEVVRLSSTLPSVEVGTSYGTPALKVGGKLFARLWEDGTTLVLRVPEVVRAHLLQADPTAFFLTDHYRGHPYVLVRLAVVGAERLTPLLAEAWRQVAPARLRVQFDADNGT